MCLWSFTVFFHMRCQLSFSTVLEAMHSLIYVLHAIPLDLQHYFLYTIEQTKKRTTNCPLHNFAIFFPMIYHVNIFLLFLFGTMKKEMFVYQFKYRNRCTLLYYILFEHVRHLIALFTLSLALQEKRWTWNTWTRLLASASK